LARYPPEEVQGAKFCGRLTMSDATIALFQIFKANQNLPGAPNWTDQQFEAELKEQESLIATDDAGSPKAFILYRKTPIAFEISYLATHPEAKRSGYMQGLLELLAIETRDLGLQIWLEVHEGNAAAIELYETFGFKLKGKRPKYYADGSSAILYNYG
jgi:[ribosomal protein S18]-alanine N-acetyltransferase